jgi:hypothetical protein
VLSFVVGACLSATAQTTAFTYQGRFNDSGSPANGFYDFSFALFDSATNGNQVGSTVIVTNVAVSGGLFTLPVDFGSTPFNGTPLWLQINARTNETVNYTLLSPRQPITSAPYAVFSSNAQAANAVAAGGITGTLNLTQLPPTIVTNGATNINISGNFSGNGNLLTNLSDGALKYLSTAPFSYSIPYSNAGTYSITVPNSATQMVVKLWGPLVRLFPDKAAAAVFPWSLCRSPRAMPTRWSSDKAGASRMVATSNQMMAPAALELQEVARPVPSSILSPTTIL